MARFSTEQLLDNVALRSLNVTPLFAAGGVIINGYPVTDFDYVRVTLQNLGGNGVNDRLIVNAFFQSTLTKEVPSSLTSNFEFVFPFSDYNFSPFNVGNYRYPQQAVNIPVLERFLYISVNDPTPAAGQSYIITVTLIKCDYLKPTLPYFGYPYMDTGTVVAVPGVQQTFNGGYLHIGEVDVAVQLMAGAAGSNMVLDIYEMGMDGPRPVSQLWRTNTTTVGPAVTDSSKRLAVRSGYLRAVATLLGGAVNGSFNVTMNPVPS